MLVYFKKVSTYIYFYWVGYIVLLLYFKYIFISNNSKKDNIYTYLSDLLVTSYFIYLLFYLSN